MSDRGDHRNWQIVFPKYARCDWISVICLLDRWGHQSDTHLTSWTQRTLSISLYSPRLSLISSKGSSLEMDRQITNKLSILNPAPNFIQNVTPSCDLTCSKGVSHLHPFTAYAVRSGQPQTSHIPTRWLFTGHPGQNILTCICRRKSTK